MIAKVNSVTFKKTKKGNDMWDMKISHPSWATQNNSGGERTFHCWKNVTEFTGKEIDFEHEKSFLNINGKDVTWKTVTKINGQAVPSRPGTSPSYPQSQPQKQQVTGWTLTPQQVECALGELSRRMAALEKAFESPKPDVEMPNI